MELSRRDVLKLGVLGSASLLLPIERIARTKGAAAGRLDPKVLATFKYRQALAVAEPMKPTLRFADYDFYVIEQLKKPANVLDNGKLTDIWGYNGVTPGPTISVRQGRKIVVRQINRLTDKHPTLDYVVNTSTHLHGSASLPEYDGYASDVTGPNQYKDYRYPNIQDSRTLWYHDHGVHQTASNAYQGLAAQYHLHDNVEFGIGPDGKPLYDLKTTGIPHGFWTKDGGGFDVWNSSPYDVPLTVRDALLGTDGQLIYDDNSESSVMGDVILCNGKPWPFMKVEPRKYRFRILNASVSRSYRFALTTSASGSREEVPMTVIATDGGLMPAPQTVGSFRHGMAERYEIIVDFSAFAGKSLYLRNLGLPNNVAYESTKDVMRFDVTLPKSGAPDLQVPTLLNPNMDVMGLSSRPDVKAKLDAIRRGTGTPDHTLELIRTNGSWTVNGTTWIDVIDSDFGKPLCSETSGAVEVWEIKNPSGGWFHPFHIHLVDFQVISRNGKAPFAWELGPKDVVYVGENESVLVAHTMAGPENANADRLYEEESKRLAADLGIAHTGQRTGRFMMHCHNLVHEDHDMMGQFWVRDFTGDSGDTDPKVDPHHPNKAAPAKDLPVKPEDKPAYDAFNKAPDLAGFRGF